MAANEIVNGIWRYPIKSMMGEEVQFADVTARGLAGDRAYAFVDQTSNRTAAVRTWASGFMSYRANFAEEPRSGQRVPAVRITSPDGETLMTSQPDIDERLSERFDRPLSLTSHAPAGLLIEFPAGTLAGAASELTEAPLAGGAPEGTFFDLACIHLVATSTIDHLKSVYPQGQVDVRRFRPNIVVQTEGEPFVENTWTGRRVAIGNQVVLKVTIPCPRCVNVTLAQDGLPRAPQLLRGIAQRNMVDLGDFGSLPCVGVYADIVEPGPIKQGDAIRWLD